MDDNMKPAVETAKVEKNEFFEVAEPAYPGWGKVYTSAGETWHNKAKGLYVIVTGRLIGGKHWVILSVMRKSRSPETEDLDFVKKVFIGEDKDCLMIMPAPTNPKHFTVKTTNTRTRQIVYCIEGDGLPIFF